MRLSTAVTATAVLLVSAGAGVPTGESAQPVCVGGPHCYQDLQAALDAAPAGARVRLHKGTFDGGITIRRDVRSVGVIAPTGATSIQGVAITNNGPLVLRRDTITGNRGRGFPVTLRSGEVAHNTPDQCYGCSSR